MMMMVIQLVERIQLGHIKPHCNLQRGNWKLARRKLCDGDGGKQLTAYCSYTFKKFHFLFDSENTQAIKNNTKTQN